MEVIEMFDEKKALKLLEEDRRKYIMEAIEFARGFLDRNMDEAAATTIITAGNELTRLDGSMLYLEQLQNFKTDEYPRFNRIME